MAREKKEGTEAEKSEEVRKRKMCWYKRNRHPREIFFFYS